jgi:DMSO/TMAO reductase YedYZ molybdopterin-dependent catalytic subunit
MNIDYDYAWKFSFYDGHFLGAWLFITGFVVHVTLKLPKMWSALKGRSIRSEMRRSLADTEPEPYEGPDGLVARDPASPTISRRGALGMVAGASAAVVALTAGEAIGGITRRAALLAPRGRSYGNGPNDFQINRTAASAGIRPSTTDASWLLTVSGPGGRQTQLSRAQLLEGPLFTAALPIACVEGWSTVQTWTGVSLRSLARLVGVDRPGLTTVESIEVGSPYSKVVLDASQSGAADALLALMVNGVDISADHGYPARTIIPAAPGVHNTKWVRAIHFEADA